ncbi:hypothetical protein [Corynebacterium neomassiliense]|uniref:hypothetical protein n=1 Tax=Corynebacterium neomassiliense TaxID=2079482 RepID=UPI0010301E64|nr:hypothetical protein [Corynebacterium neomassiliense]
MSTAVSSSVRAASSRTAATQAAGHVEVFPDDAGELTVTDVQPLRQPGDGEVVGEMLPDVLLQLGDSAGPRLRATHTTSSRTSWGQGWDMRIILPGPSCRASQIR